MHTEFEHNIRQEHGPRTLIIGMDEAGCGPWAGPVVVGACALHPKICANFLNDVSHHKLNLRDSKTLSQDQRENVYHYLTTRPHHIAVATGSCDASEIDTHGLAEALRRAARRAYDQIMGVVKSWNDECAGSQVVLMDGIRDPKLPCATHLIKKGDAQCASIAAGAIMAKVTRDRIMCTLHLEYPQYGWITNMGYGTKAHQEGLTQHGITPHHRTSFKPIQRVCA